MKYIKMWVDNYAKPGYPDQRALQDFVDCENAEVQSSLRSELGGVARGNVSPDSMESIVGKSRIARHGSYEAWAGLMLQWMANCKRS